MQSFKIRLAVCNLRAQNKCLMKNIIRLSFLLVIPTFLQAQRGPSKSVDSLDEKFLNWHTLDLKDDKIPGASIERAYDFLDGKKAKATIVVAVIDAGIDLEHEDLSNKIWVNEDEVPDNGLDDDGNGYVDDVHGWNFLGNADGEDIHHENFEYVRIYRDLDKKYGTKVKSDLPESEKEEYDYYKRLEKMVKSNQDTYVNAIEQINEFKRLYKKNNGYVEAMLDEGYTEEELREWQPESQNLLEAKGFMMEVFKQGVTLEIIDQQKESVEKFLKYHLNPELNARDIIGDDLSVLNDMPYGNPDCEGPDPFHGTFVAGLIGAERNNGVGLDGIAANVKLMSLRAVPDGDEYDKDVANAIRYAVDNGAKIINMSFGKAFSPETHLVYEAARYAEENGVLLIHAAGNDAKDIVAKPNFPNAFPEEGDRIESYLTVGANSIDRKKELPARFSNYSEERVDLFAPGVLVSSTFPNDQYGLSNGTSFAAPIVSGVAALIWSYYPNLTALEVKEILLSTVTDYGRKKVFIPGGGADPEKIRFRELSVTGGMVNAYEALKEAEKRSN